MTLLARTVTSLNGTSFETIFIASGAGKGGVTLSLQTVSKGGVPLLTTMLLSRDERQALRLYLNETKHLERE